MGGFLTRNRPLRVGATHREMRPRRRRGLAEAEGRAAQAAARARATKPSEARAERRGDAEFERGRELGTTKYTKWRANGRGEVEEGLGGWGGLE